MDCNTNFNVNFLKRNSISYRENVDLGKFPGVLKGSDDDDDQDDAMFK